MVIYEVLSVVRSVLHMRLLGWFELTSESDQNRCKLIQQRSTIHFFEQRNSSSYFFVRFLFFWSKVIV